jgi:hypothetical protein
VAAPPGAAAFEHVAHPEQGLDIVDQRRPPEEADLERIGRLVARLTALALDRFDERRFLAADIGAGAPAQMQPRQARGNAAISRARIARAAGYSSRM